MFENTDIKINNIAIFQGSAVRNTMTDNLIDRSKFNKGVRAQGFGKLVVVER